MTWPVTRRAAVFPGQRDTNQAFDIAQIGELLGACNQ